MAVRLPAQSYAFTTVAGSSGVGYVDATGAAARFGILQDVKVDAAGNLYVSDYANFVIRKITPDGVVSTLAGLAGVQGSTNGTGSAARFGLTFGLGLDRDGNLLVTDATYSTIRRVTPAGVVTTVAGAVGVRGSTDGPISVARFNSPNGVCADAGGNIYVADSSNHTIRRISSDGVVSTMAGLAGVRGSTDGSGSAARFSNPGDVAVDTAGNLYVADTGNQTIRKMAPDGTVTTLAGSAGVSGTTSGTGAAARFSLPSRLVVNAAGEVFVADRANDAIRRITPGGAVTTLAGLINSRGYLDGAATQARFFNPTGVALDAAGNLFVADTYNSCIRRVSTAGVVTTVAGTGGIGSRDGLGSAAGFFAPLGLARDAGGNIYVADSYNQTIRRVAPDGTVTTIAGLAGIRGSVDGVGSEARFMFPHSVAVDPAGNVYVSDNSNHTIRKITPARVVGTLAGLAGQAGSANGALSAARFYVPNGIAADEAGNLYVADSGNHTIRKVSRDGVVTTVAGVPGSSGTADGFGTAARFNFPFGLALDAAGNLYITDTNNSTIRRMATSGEVTTLVGQAGVPGSTDGIGGAARLFGPEGISVDAAGNLYFVDAGNQLVRMVTPAGAVTTLGGGGVLGNADGLGTQARFFTPRGIVADAIGNLWITDYYNNTIRRGGQVAAPNPTASLVNLAVRAGLTAGQRLVVGFSMTGDAKSVLVRAVGPGLAPFLGGTAVVADPALELYDAASNLTDGNDNWGGGATLSGAFGRVGAFPLSGTSRDAALLREVRGTYSAHLVPPTGGVGLIEVYDAGNISVRGSRLTNLSARYQASSGSGALIAGFVVNGTGHKTLLIRGIGPRLAAFGVSGPMDDPLIEVFSAAGQRIAGNDNWPVSLQTAFTQAGAFALTTGSRDAALLVSLAPGAYTAQLTGADGGSGTGLIEVYEVGN